MGWSKAPALVVADGALHHRAGPTARPRTPHRRARRRPSRPTRPCAAGGPTCQSRSSKTFEQRDDVDTCARIDIAITGAAVIVKVTLPDGRTAARSVLRREDVLPALEALLLLPESGSEPPPRRRPRPAPRDTAAKPARALRPERIAATVTIIPQQPPAPSTDGRTETHLRIELGLGVEARAGDGQVGAGFGVASFLELAHWLLGFQARIDGYRLLAR